MKSHFVITNPFIDDLQWYFNNTPDLIINGLLLSLTSLLISWRTVIAGFIKRVKDRSTEARSLFFCTEWFRQSWVPRSKSGPARGLGDHFWKADPLPRGGKWRDPSHWMRPNQSWHLQERVSDAPGWKLNALLGPREMLRSDKVSCAFLRIKCEWTGWQTLVMGHDSLFTQRLETTECSS